MNNRLTEPTKAVLFDCDGVLVDSEPALAKIAAIALNDLGAPAQADDFKAYIGRGEDVYLGEVLKKYGMAFSNEIKAHVYERYIELADSYVSAFAGVNELLDKLKALGYEMAVASSADLIKVEANLKVLAAPADTFTAVITGSDVVNKKPHPEIYLLAAERCKVAPEDCFVVEDAISGIQSAKAAGMTAIGFISAHTASELKNAGADIIIKHMADVFKFVI